MVSKLPPPDWEGSEESAMVLPPPLDIEPEQSLCTEELEAGTAGFSPDRLLQRPQEGNNESTIIVLPPSLASVPGQSLSTEELEAGTESSSPDRLLQRSKEGNTEGILVLAPPRAVAPEQSQRVIFQPGTTLVSSSTMLPTSPPSPPPLRRVIRNCCSSDLKEKQRARQECRGCVILALRSGCCVVAASVAILIAYWSLFPMCTTCEDRYYLSTSSASSATEIAAMASSGTEIAAMASDGTGGSGATESSVRPFSTLRINQLQVIGTHNSYHRRTSIPTIGDMFAYDFPSIAGQLDAGVRHLELDVHYDWKTGRWFVYHISVVDSKTSCNCFRSCLEEILAWSDLNPMHHIIFMDIELKLTGDFLRLCGDHTPDQDKEAFRILQDTILDAIPEDRVLTPQMVQGDYSSLFEAVREGGSCVGGKCGSNVSSSVSGEAAVGAVPGMAGGWPLVDDSRGMILFVMDYQTVNLRCRDAVRKALPVDETVFFERIPLTEIKTNSPYAAFTQLCQCGLEWEKGTRSRANKGLIVRQSPHSSSWVVPGAGAMVTSTVVTGNETYLADTPAQLLVSDDYSRGVAKGVCRSRCTKLVPEEECVLEGFC